MTSSFRVLAGHVDRASWRGRLSAAGAGVLLLVWCVLLVPGTAAAHSLGQTYLYVLIYEESTTFRFEVTAADLNRALGTELDETGALTEAGIAPHSDAIVDYLRRNIVVAPDGEAREPEFVRHTIRDTSTAQYVLSEFVVAPLEVPAYIDFEYGVLFDVDTSQSGVLVIESNWREHTFANEAGISLVFESDARRQRLDLSGSTLMTGVLAMVSLGAAHILEGADHIMFLLALLLTAIAQRVEGRWQLVPRFSLAMWNVLKIVTVFTIAHSITLSLAALETLVLAPRLVESVIAASIALAALDVFVPIFGRRIVAIVFLFGLFHGAGFASVLLSMDIPSDYTVLTLLGFNIGVEVGQVAIVCLVLPLLYLVRNTPQYLRYGMPTVAGLLIAVSLYWFVERAFGVDLPAGEYAQRLFAIVT